MPLSQPLTTLTDYAIALECLLFALLLLGGKSASHRLSVSLWALAFCCVAIATLTAGTSHGFLATLENDSLHQLWAAMVYSLSGASFAMLAATVMSELNGLAQRVTLVGVGLKSVIYLTAIGVQSSFAFVAIDYLSAMAIVFLLHGISFGRNRQRAHCRWCIAGVIVSGIASAIHASELKIIQGVNHNDLYHLVQMVGLYLFYRGADRLKTSKHLRSQENFN